MTITRHIGFLLYPNLTQLDMTGPAQVLGRMPGTKLHFAWKTREPVSDDMGLSFSPTTTLADCPQLDILCVPGGYGCAAMMEDMDVLDWLRRQDEGTEYTTSVCTGSLVLAAAGLLRGHRAACHWAWREKLTLFGTTCVPDRVVEDGKYITGGGVTAGIDFGFRIAEKLHGRDFAESLQLGLEYDPQPLGGGTPESARTDILTATMKNMDARGMKKRLADVDRIALSLAAAAK